MSDNNTFDKRQKEKSFIFAKSIKEEMSILSIIWIKISIQSLLALVPKVMGSMFVGNLDSTESAVLLSAVGLATNFSDMSGMTIGWGFTSGLLTLLPQTIGSGRMDLISHFSQRAFYISSFVLILSTITQFYSGDILCYILNYNNTPNEAICEYITLYCIYLIPFLYFITWFSIIKRIIQNLRYNTELMIIIFISVVLTPFWNWFFVYHLKFGYLGTAITSNIVLFCMVAMSVTFLCYKGYGYIFKPVPIGTIMKWKDVKYYFNLTVPGLFSMMSSWWIGALVIIISGRIVNPTISVASMVVVYSVYEIILWIAVGLGNSVNIRIGKYIGCGSIQYAQNVVKIACTFNVMFVTLFTLFLELLKGDIPKLYSNDSDVIEQSSKLIHCIVFVLIAASIYRILDGIFYGLGYPTIVAVILFISQDIIGLGSIFISLFVFNYKRYTNMALELIWIFIAFGFALASFGLIIVLIYKKKTIWNNAVNDSQMRIKTNLQSKPFNQDHNQSMDYGSVQ